jgi:hypothetical protein
MKIKDILQRDPAEHALANQGQARIVDTDDDRALQELRGELSSFVCEGQYARGIDTVLRSFLGDLGKSSQRAAWVSGFFGSGKSHLLKMLCHLWQDTEFPDGATARSLVPSIPDDISALLRELDTAGKRSGGLLAAAGSLLGGKTDNVRLTVLGIIFKGVGLPEKYPAARFCLWLKEQGYYDEVKSKVEASGKSFDKELADLYPSRVIARAILDVDPAFAPNEAEMRNALRASFPQSTGDITTADFMRESKRALGLAGKDGRIPCTILILDEAQQYIGDVSDRSSVFTEVTEALCKQFDSQVMVVAAGQNALTAVPNLHKLLDRYIIRVPLSDVDVENVTRKVLLQKKPTAVADVKKLLDTHAGEVSRHLHGTRIGQREEDKKTIVEDYPLLPVRRRFWEECFRQIDKEGTHSQLRSQLRIIHDAVAGVSDRPLGTVLSASELYDSLSTVMVQTNVLLREIQERIIQIGETHGDLARKICGLVFLIGKVRRDDASDIGVRSSKEHIADLLVEELHGDNGKLRNDVGEILDKLADAGHLLRVGEEFRLQTREGSEWDREFRDRQSKLRNDESNLQFRRDQLLYATFDKVVRGVKLLQGAAKEPRQLNIHRDQTPPQEDGQSLVVWVRDGFNISETEHQNAARVAGSDNPVIFVHIPRQDADALRQYIVDADAAEQTLNAKGNPGTGEGQEARTGMDSRLKLAQQQREDVVKKIVGNAKVFQGGGSEVLSIELHDRLRDAAEASLVRQFPRFKEADSAAWGAVLKQVKERGEHPFKPLGHNDLIEKHAVCAQVLSTIGAGKVGTDIRKALLKSPFGWGQDAIDAALMALHNAQHVNVTLNGNTLSPGDLDQNKIAKAEFRSEHITLTIQDKIRVRKLYKALNITCSPGEESERAAEFLTMLLHVAREAGGDAPLPAHPNLTPWQDIHALHGNERLIALKDQADAIEGHIKDWKALSDLRIKRLPEWILATKLARQGGGVDGIEAHVHELDAIREQRLLLEANNPVAPVLKALADLLRQTVNALHAEQAKRHQAALKELAANDSWQRLDAADQEAILADVGLRAPAPPSIGSDEALTNYLETHTLESMRSTIDAIPGRVSQALQRAAKKLEPEVQTVRIDRATLRTPDEVEAWLAKQKKRVLDALQQGPVLID